VQTADPELRRLVEETLHRLGADYLVVGHKPTKRLGYIIGHPHPAFGTSVAAIDTGISKFYGGRLSAIDCAGDIIPRYVDRGTAELPLTQQLRRRAEEERERLTEEAAASDR
jgi:hypothetical protein